MPATAASGFHIRAIPQDDLAAIRAVGVDRQGNLIEPRVITEPGAPLRCCLREARTGERIALVAHRPAPVDGPYAEVGPVFIHADACPGYGSPAEYPEGFRHRRQVFRPYSADGSMIYDGIEVVEGADAEQAILRILARPDVARIDSRNVLPGCFMFTVERAVG